MALIDFRTCQTLHSLHFDKKRSVSALDTCSLLSTLLMVAREQFGTHWFQHSHEFRSELMITKVPLYLLLLHTESHYSQDLM